MTPNTLRRTARICLVFMVLLAFAASAAPWLTRANGDILIGLDLGYLATDLHDQPYPVLHLFVAATHLPIYLAILLAPGVAVRSRWGRIVAVLLGLLATAIAILMAIGLRSEIEDYWEPARTQRYELFAVAVGLIAVVVLATVVTLAVGQVRAYGVAVAVLLVGAAGFHLYSVVVLSSLTSINVEVSPPAWVPGPAWLLAAGCALVAVLADLMARPSGEAGGGHPDQAGQGGHHTAVPGPAEAYRTYQG